MTNAAQTPKYRCLARGTIALVMRWKKTTIAIATLALLATIWPASKLGSEFMPPLDEGDLLYMPVTLPGITTREAAKLLVNTVLP